MRARLYRNPDPGGSGQHGEGQPKFGWVTSELGGLFNWMVSLVRSSTATEIEGNHGVSTQLRATGMETLVAGVADCCAWGAV